MNIVTGDITPHLHKSDVVIFTSNSVLKYDRDLSLTVFRRRLVMGAGNAKVIRDYYKDIDLQFGRKLEMNFDKTPCQYGLLSEVYINQYNEPTLIFALQTKIHYQDKQPNYELLEFSLSKLRARLLHRSSYFNTRRIDMFYPGINHAGFTVKEVQPLLEKYLSDININIWRR